MFSTPAITSLSFPGLIAASPTSLVALPFGIDWYDQPKGLVRFFLWLTGIVDIIVIDVSPIVFG
jgi:hypothetical protein